MFQRFKDLHYQPQPLLLGNVWNVESARIFQATGFSAIATSSIAIAHSLGYADGEHISFDELLYVVKRILASVSIPVSVDMESGYSQNDVALLNRKLKRLAESGVSGINIEDSYVVQGKRLLHPMSDFCSKLLAIKRYLFENGHQLFINVRTDAYLMRAPDAFSKTLDRVIAYGESGADCVFPIHAKDKDEIRFFTRHASLPINILAFDGCDIQDLTVLGVNRISFGSLAFNSTYKSLHAVMQSIHESQSTVALFNSLR